MEMVYYQTYADKDEECQKLQAKVDKYEKALDIACLSHADFTGSCPLDADLKNADDICENNCDDNSAKCYKQYFLKQALTKEGD